MVRPPVAQPDRASDSESGGRAFESRRAGHDIIERVARAMALADDEDYMEDFQRYDRRARAAIAAMREPNLPMMRSARLAMIRDDLQPTESEVEAGWRAAIDEALSGKESG